MDRLSALFGADEKTTVIEGQGCIQQLAGLCSNWKARRVLVVSDPGVVAAGHAGQVMQILAGSGIVCELFAEVNENPSTEDVDRGFAPALAFQPDAIVAVGGGSAIDVAKGVDFLLSCGGRMQDYWGPNKATNPLLPIIAIPTTAGTGSEVQSFALIIDPLSHQKMACGDPSAAPRFALLDPELSLSMPRRVSACTGIDTLGHAVESAVSLPRNAISSAYSREAFRLTSSHLERVLEEPSALDARAGMLRAAAMAGFAIEHSMLGAAHSLANPLSAHLGLPHGEAVGLALPVVVEWNGELDEIAAIYAELLAAAGIEATAQPGRRLAGYLRDLLQAADMPVQMSELRDGSLLAILAAEASKQWTAQFNPRPVDVPALTQLLRALAA